MKYIFIIYLALLFLFKRIFVSCLSSDVEKFSKSTPFCLSEIKVDFHLK